MGDLRKLLIAFTFILFTSFSNLMAQEIQGGIITYEQVVDYQLEGAYDDPIWDDYIAEMPRSGKSFFVLAFTKEQALYSEDPSKPKAISGELKTAIYKANYDKTPQPQVKQRFFDLKAQKITEQLEFMTRNFQVESGLEKKAWKLGPKKKKIMDYVCMGADLEVGKETITAWFTPELPFSIGPDSYYGLPGVILGLEKNEEVFLLATSISFDPPNHDLYSQLEKGRKLTEEEFDLLTKEKIEEFKKERAAEENKYSKSKKN